MCVHRSSHAKEVTFRDSENQQYRPYLSLKEVRGDNLAPVPIEESQSRAEGGCRDAPKNGLSDDTPPARLRHMNSYYC